MAQDPFKYFRVEAAELLEQIGQCLLDLDREVPVAERLPALLRHIHTMKGAARVVKLPTIAETAHHMEDLLAPYRNTTSALPRDTIDQLLKLNDAIGAHVLALNEKPTPAATAIAPKPVAPIVEPLRSTRNDTSDVDALLERISGTVATLGGVRPTLTQVEQLRSWIDLLSKQLSAPVRDATRSTAPNAEAQALVRRLDDATRALERDLSEHVERLERDLEEVRTTAEGLRLVPASLVFTTLERAARDTARELGKPAHLHSDQKICKHRTDNHKPPFVR